MNVKTMYNKIRQSVHSMDVVEDSTRIENTRRVLSELHYEPPFLLPVDGFSSFTREDALRALDRLYNTPDDRIQKMPVAASHPAGEIKQKTLEMFLKEFTLLQRLRADDPEAWDHINELYEDD
ncbi:MAG: hypothetical protein ACOC2H_05770 [Spirochaetota bacterium]